MTEKEKRQHRAEEFVSKVLKDTFKQRASAETVRTVAKKVSRAVPASKPKVMLQPAE
jgi:hypothetical protein